MGHPATSLAQLERHGLMLQKTAENWEDTWLK